MMKLISTLSLALTLLSSSSSSSVLGAAVKRATDPSQNCVQAEKYVGISNSGYYSPACALLVSLSHPCPPLCPYTLYIHLDTGMFTYMPVSLDERRPETASLRPGQATQIFGA